ncbi:winged helix domain-containing protein [Thetidibacter halocola]|uniref:winged helix domain-containing protein n=1 Tax=Thetidibacter halocola TaxID=2827239 RepID=UPI003D160E9E
MSGKKNAPCSGQAGTARDIPFAAATDTQNVSTRRVRRQSNGTPYRVTPSAGDPFRIVVGGRVRWALDRLRAANDRGCTPITEPAPRWAAYVHSLRELGVEIETVAEPHGGEFSGHHARYVLRCQAAPDWKGGAEC